MSAAWLKFYPSDWRADPSLRMCSVGARGLWIEMLCVMHEAQPYGYLLVNGRPLTDLQLAALTGVNPQDIPPLKGELEAAGVFSFDGEGRIYSRRMVRDAAKALEDKENGKKGGRPAATPTQGRQGVNPPLNPHRADPENPQKPEARDQIEDTFASQRTAEAVVIDITPLLDDKDKLWSEGLSDLLSIASVPERQARSLIGRWLKMAGEDAAMVLGAIARARDQKIGDPVPWITRFLHIAQKAPHDQASRKDRRDIIGALDRLDERLARYAAE